ncbi:MAG: DMT family transporter [Proteobacteria bacterium]|nr:DMT family transporter [Pseudomonadota bacterium]NBP14933.1 DMT family transporter [bacterium]
MIQILLLYAFFASTFTIGSEAIKHVAPLFFTGIRMITSGILLLAFYRFFQNGSFKIKREEIKWFIVILLFHIYFSFGLEYISYKYLSGAKVCLLYNLSPFITALFSYIFFYEKMTIKKWIGFIVGFLGFLPMLLEETPIIENTLGSIGFVSYAELMAIGSVISSCIGWIAMRKLTTEHNHSYFFVNAFGMFFGGLLTLASAPLFETAPTITALTNPSFLVSLSLLILIGNVFAFNLYAHLLHRYTATMISFFGFITPLFTAFYDWVWFGTTVSLSFYLTIAFVTYGLYLFYQEELKQGYIIQD